MQMLLCAYAGAERTHYSSCPPQPPFKKKVSVLENTELDRGFSSFPFCLLVQYEKLSANSIRAFRLLDKGAEGEIQQDGRQTRLSQAKSFLGHL